jgi:adenylylsulfate reductase subunit A
MIVDILKDQEKIIGAAGFDIRTGHFYHIHSKVTILATGAISQLWKNPTPYMFNAWHGAYNGAASYYFAWQAGAEIANSELSGTSLVPSGFSAAGFNAIFGLGGYLINSKGERFTLKHHPKGEKAPRWLVCWAVHEEKKAGNGPIYADVRHFSPEVLAHLKTDLLPVDKLTFMDYLDQKEIDLSKDLLEVDLSEQALPGYSGKPFGIFMDKHSQTAVDGLFAAGVCCTPCYALSGSITTGISAGRSAGNASRRLPEPTTPSLAYLETIKERIAAPLNRTKGISWQKFEQKRQDVMSGHVGFERNEKGLLTALKKIEDLEDDYSQIKAENYHELMRTIAAGHLLEVSKIVINGALERKESRFGHGHYRSDYPESRKEFHGSILLKKEKKSYLKRFIPAQM